jgi:hypothetical protein
LFQNQNPYNSLLLVRGAHLQQDGKHTIKATRCSYNEHNTNLWYRKYPGLLRDLAKLKFCACLWRFSGQSPCAHP